MPDPIGIAPVAIIVAILIILFSIRLVAWFLRS